MCKKLVVAAVAILAGTVIVKHTSIGSLAQVWWNDAKRVVERQVPPEVQIKRLANEIAKIDADIKRNLSRLAQQEVETTKLDEEVASLKDSQTALAADMTAMGKSLEGDIQQVKFDTKVARMQRKLELATTTFTRRKAELKSKETLLSTKREALEAAHARISEMTTQKEQLKVVVGELEARLQLAKLNAIRNNAGVDLDESQVARCKELANQISENLAVEEKTGQLYSKYGYTNPVPKAVEETKSTSEVLKAARKALEEDGEQRIVNK